MTHNRSGRSRFDRIARVIAYVLFAVAALLSISTGDPKLMLAVFVVGLAVLEMAYRATAPPKP